jgi:hypothetical protein
MFTITYVLVPDTVHSAEVMRTCVCLGSFPVPCIKECTLFACQGDPAPNTPWFHACNVVLVVKSRFLKATQAVNFKDMAIAAALESSRGTCGAAVPPALNAEAKDGSAAAARPPPVLPVPHQRNE